MYFCGFFEMKVSYFILFNISKPPLHFQYLYKHLDTIIYFCCNIIFICNIVETIQLDQKRFISLRSLKTRILIKKARTLIQFYTQRKTIKKVLKLNQIGFILICKNVSYVTILNPVIAHWRPLSEFRIVTVTAHDLIGLSSFHAYKIRSDDESFQY